MIGIAGEIGALGGLQILRAWYLRARHATKKFRGFYFFRKTSTWKNEKKRKQDEKIEDDSLLLHLTSTKRCLLYFC